MLKSARHHYFPTFPRIRDKLSWKKSALVTSEILLLFANTLTHDDKYSLRNMPEIPATNSNAFISRIKHILSISDCISEMCMKFRTFWKKRTISQPKYYRNYCIRKSCLLKRLKGWASRHHSVINVLMGSKHCWGQHGTTIFLFFREFEINWIGKSLP